MIVQLVHEGEVLREYGDLTFGADVPARGDVVNVEGGWRPVMGRLWGGRKGKTLVRVVLGPIQPMGSSPPKLEVVPVDD